MSVNTHPSVLDGQIQNIYSSIDPRDYSREDFENRFLALAPENMNSVMNWKGDCFGFCGIMGRELQQLGYTVQFGVLQLLQLTEGKRKSSMRTTVKVIGDLRDKDTHIDISAGFVYLSHNPARQSIPPSTITVADFLEFKVDKTPQDYFLELGGCIEQFIAMRASRIDELLSIPGDGGSFTRDLPPPKVIRL